MTESQNRRKPGAFLGNLLLLFVPSSIAPASAKVGLNRVAKHQS
jgi:hypothetical protein